MAVDPALFRRVMGNFATGVTVLTTIAPDGVYGMTANAISSVSLDPTLVLACIDVESQAHSYVKNSRVYALNVLSAEQRHLAELFARDESAPERKLAGVDYDRRQSGAPILRGALAYADCRVVAEYPGGDHTIFVGEVEDAAVLDPHAEPLVFFRSQYQRVQS